MSIGAILLDTAAAPTDDGLSRGERAYRRGVSQTLWFVANLARDRLSRADLDLLAEEADAMREEPESHPAYLDELSQRFRARKKGSAQTPTEFLRS